MLWLIIAIMIIIALAIILLPLLRSGKVLTENRNEQNIHIAKEQLAKLKEDTQQGIIKQEDYDSARSDLEKTLHSDLASKPDENKADAGTAYIMSASLIVLIPVMVISLYYSLGSPSLVSIQQTNQSTPDVQAGKVADIESMFESLKQRLEQNPDDVQGWMMMGLTHMYYEQFEQALYAYKKADVLLPGDSDIQQALARAEKALAENNASDVIEKKILAPNGQTIDVGAMVMRLRAKLESNPDNLQGWLMLGRSYTNLGRYSDAVGAYQQALSLKPNDPEIQGLLDSAKESLNQ
ncbi:MAG: c-type cytochrome biogenesis protein CcmI [Methylophaga sp.]|nr:c-type cytochrome biogenesis protein CcmI [Methylophaga sp.]